MRPVANRARIFSPRAGMVLSYRSRVSRQDRRHDHGVGEIFYGLLAYGLITMCLYHNSASAFSMASLTSPQRVIAASSFSLMAL